jgi:hypothetical protein
MGPGSALAFARLSGTTWHFDSDFKQRRPNPQLALRCERERSSLFLIPPTRGEGGHIVSGANDVTGGGWWVYARATPTRRFEPP